MIKISHTLRCPVCKRTVSSKGTSSSFPFCGEKCREADLGNWLTGQYAIPAMPDDLDDPSFEDETVRLMNEAAENDE